MQPSKGLHNQVVKIVVPYCTAHKNKIRFVTSVCQDPQLCSSTVYARGLRYYSMLNGKRMQYLVYTIHMPLDVICTVLDTWKSVP